MIYSDDIRLRTVEREDIPTFLRWFNDPEVRRYLLMFEPMSKAKEERWFEARLDRTERLPVWHRGPGRRRLAAHRQPGPAPHRLGQQQLHLRHCHRRAGLLGQGLWHQGHARRPALCLSLAQPAPGRAGGVRLQPARDARLREGRLSSGRHPPRGALSGRRLPRRARDGDPAQRVRTTFARAGLLTVPRVAQLGAVRRPHVSSCAQSAGCARLETAQQ